MRALVASSGWFVSILACVAASSLLCSQRAIRPLAPAVDARIEGAFPRDGQFPGFGGLAEAPEARVWASWAGGDERTGRLTFGPFAAPRRLRLGVVGYPHHEGSQLYLERLDTHERLPIPTVAITGGGEKFRLAELALPRAWRRRDVQLVAIDAGTTHLGWLGVTEPLGGGWGDAASTKRTLTLAWALQVLAFALGAVALARAIVRRRHRVDDRLNERGPAIALGLFAAAALPWALWQHAREPHFTRVLVGLAGWGAVGALLAGLVVATPQRVGERLRALAASVRQWWRAPSLNGWVLGAIALLLFLRKPHALHTAQLWAEDGSIFLAFNDLFGARALLDPYMGYLHTIPRLIAWLGARLLDPAWWPTFYNGASFAIWVAVVARTFSRRLALPHKPWLALAFFLGPHTGEVLFNITNLQWLTALALVQLALIARPVNTAERVGDLLTLLLIGLTGPFAIAFVPLFAWRAWRERDGDALAAFAVVTLCAGVQAWFIVHTSQRFPYQDEPFRIWPNIEVLARRLLVWPALGDKLALALPKPLVGVLGLALIGGLVAWALRPDARRELRFRLLLALGLIVAVCVYRTRPDTWDHDNLYYGDRYFYIPRVLFAWLLILEFDASRRAIRWLARGVCALMAGMHLIDYPIAAPPDYHWAAHVDPIRRGVPADIPTLPEGWTMEYRGRPKR